VPGSRSLLAVVLVLVLAPVLLHWPHLSGWLSENPAFSMSGIATGAGVGQGPIPGYPGWIDGNAGVTTQALGGLAAREWLAGAVPWWNQYSGVGLPLAAELVYLKILLQILAGFCCAALLRELGLGRLAAMVGALCFELNGSFAWFSHGPIMPVAFLPLLLFGIERARTRACQGAFWVGAAIAWSLLAGFPEVAYLDGLLALAWAALRAAQDRRLAPAAAIAGGGLAGLLVAAPPLLAFAQSLPLSFLGNHVDFRAAVLAPANRAALLFPYLFGPPMYGGLRLTGAGSLAQFIHWFKTAGYLDLGLLTLAAAALRRRAPDGGLRVLLGLWLAVMLGRALGVPAVSAAVNLAPLVRNTMFDLYIMPACQMAVTVLAALALQDWRCGRLSARRAAGGAVLVAVAALATLPGAAPMVTTLRALPGFAAFPLLSVAAAGAVVVGAALLLARPATPARARLLATLLVGHAAVLCFLPLLAGTPRPRGIDRAAMDWIARQPGETRVSAIGALNPNYGAWFGVSAIEHNYLPVPQAWVDNVRATLLPGMDGVNNVATATDAAGLAALRARLPALADHAVDLLVVPPGVDPFSATITGKLVQAGNVAYPLTDALSGAIAGGVVTAGRATAASIDLGTYRGAARGQVRLELCQQARCAAGQADVAGAADNSDLAIALQPPLDLAAGQALTYTIRLLPGAGPPPAVWLWPSADGPGRAPRLTVLLAPPPGAPARVYADATLAVYRLGNAAPYFQADGCALTPASRTELRAWCSRPSRLLRRELSYPGWRAWRDGAPVPLGADGIYQAAPLPAGRSHWRFAYAPPGAGYAWWGSACGVAALLGLGWLGWGRSFGLRAMIGRSTQRLIA
jgi:hypothetical protein